MDLQVCGSSAGSRKRLKGHSLRCTSQNKGPMGSAQGTVVMGWGFSSKLSRRYRWKDIFMVQGSDVLQHFFPRFLAFKFVSSHWN